MGQKKQFQLEAKQREKRRKSRKQLSAKGQNVDEYFYGRYYLKPKSSEEKSF